jgi:hypothetical protein
VPGADGSCSDARLPETGPKDEPGPRRVSWYRPPLPGLGRPRLPGRGSGILATGRHGVLAGSQEVAPGGADSRIDPARGSRQAEPVGTYEEGSTRPGYGRRPRAVVRFLRPTRKVSVEGPLKLKPRAGKAHSKDRSAVSVRVSCDALRSAPGRTAG